MLHRCPSLLSPWLLFNLGSSVCSPDPAAAAAAGCSALLCSLAPRTKKKVTLTRGGEGAGSPQGFVYVGEAVDGATLLAEDNLPEVVCARLGAPEQKERGIGMVHV